MQSTEGTLPACPLYLPTSDSKAHIKLCYTASSISCVKQQHECSKGFCRYFLRVIQTNKCTPGFLSMTLKGANFVNYGVWTQSPEERPSCSLPASTAGFPSWTLKVLLPLFMFLLLCSPLLLICKLCVELESSA